MNVRDPYALPLRGDRRAVSRHSDVAAAEIVGLAPRAVLVGFPEGLGIAGFDPARQISRTSRLVGDRCLAPPVPDAPNTAATLPG